jgi:hypothetical protein
MICARMLCSFALAAFGAALSGSCAAQNDRLRHDPFARPALGNLSQGTRPVMKTHGKPHAGTEARHALKVQAVIVAGANSIANVDGRLVRIGERIHGYRLVSVHERSAIFDKDGRQVTVSMGGNARVAQASAPQPDQAALPEAAGSVRPARADGQ